MDVYGLTGGIGSGKSTVANLLEEYGVPVVSADELSRIVVSPGSEGLREVAEEFGRGVLTEDGELDRAKLASIVFADPDRRRRLEEILHPRIRERFEQVLDALEKAGHEVAVYEVPLLFEKNLQGDMKAVMLVTAPEAVRVRRVCARDDVTETEVRARIAAQMPEEDKRRRADYIIENDGNVDALRREVEFLLARFLRVRSVIKRGPASEEVVASPHSVANDPSLPLVAGPSRRPTFVAADAPVRTGQTLPPPTDAPIGARTSSAATLVAGAAASSEAPRTSDPTQTSGPMVAAPEPGAPSPATTMPSAPIVARSEPEATAPSPSTTRPSAPVAVVDEPAGPVSTTTDDAEPPATEVPVADLSTPPSAPPLRRPTEARATVPVRPPSAAARRPGGLRKPRAADELKKKPTAPPLAPPKATRTPPPPPVVTPAPTQQTMVGPAPAPPPNANATARAAVVPPPPPRTQTERVPVIAPAAAETDEEPT